MLEGWKCHMQRSKEAIRSLKSLEKRDNGFGVTMGIQRIRDSQCDDLVNYSVLYTQAFCLHYGGQMYSSLLLALSHILLFSLLIPRSPSPSPSLSLSLSPSLPLPLPPFPSLPPFLIPSPSHSFTLSSYHTTYMYYTYSHTHKEKA